MTSYVVHAGDYHEDLHVEAEDYEIREDGDLVFVDENDVEVGRVVKFGEIRGASVFVNADEDEDSDDEDEDDSDE